MGKIKALFTGLASNPIYAIGVIMAGALLIFGLYLGSPWYVGGATTAIGQAFDQTVPRVILAGLYIVPTFSVILGTKYKGFRRFGMFGTALMYLFASVLRITTIGFTPFIWVFLLACALASGVVYLYVSLKTEGEEPDGLL